jgi:hypothetical protein
MSLTLCVHFTPPSVCLYTYLQEEQGSGTARHLFVELPLSRQPKYVPQQEVARREREVFMRQHGEADACRMTVSGIDTNCLACVVVTSMNTV